MEKVMADNTERLEKLIGFDAAKRQGVTQELFQEVLGEVKKERFEKAKGAAREQLLKAIELREKMYNIEKEFSAQRKKFDKELGKLLGRLESSLGGQPEPQEDEEASE